MFYLKGGIHSSDWSTFLYNIREPRYNQIKMGYHISKFLNIGQSSVLKFGVPYCFTFITAPLCFIEMGVERDACLMMCPLKWDMSQTT